VRQVRVRTVSVARKTEKGWGTKTERQSEYGLKREIDWIYKACGLLWAPAVS